MAHERGSSGPSSDDESGLHHEDSLNPNAIYYLPRDVSEALAVELRTSGYKLIREDGHFAVYAPEEGISSAEIVPAETRPGIKKLLLLEERVNDVVQGGVVFGGYQNFHFTAVLPKQQGQPVQQKLTIGGLFRTFKVTDTSHWARMEVTSFQWNVSPSMLAGEDQVGYFVDCIELNVRPCWEDPSVSCRHAPQIEYAKVEETKIVQKEKSGSFELSFSNAFGATFGGGITKTVGSEQKSVKTPCKEQWLVNDEGGTIGGYYKWELNYWQNEDGAILGVPTSKKGSTALLPSVPKTTMLANQASVDWLLPPFQTGPGKSGEPLVWEVTCAARAVFLTRKKLKWRFGKVYQIVPSIVHAGKRTVIELPHYGSPDVPVGRQIYVISLLVLIVALIILKFM